METHRQVAPVIDNVPASSAEALPIDLSLRVL
jgi:hypothetical protein